MSKSRDYSRLLAFMIEPTQEAVDAVIIPPDTQKRLDAMPRKMIEQWKAEAVKEASQLEETEGE